MKKILITGGAGFIGSNLCEKLLDLGVKVTCLDNFDLDSSPQYIKLNNDKNSCVVLAPLKSLAILESISAPRGNSKSQLCFISGITES